MELKLIKYLIKLGINSGSFYHSDCTKVSLMSYKGLTIKRQFTGLILSPDDL